MGRQRSAAGASLLALAALVAAPPIWFVATGDLILAAVGGLVVGFAAAYLILVVAIATRDCSGYLEGAGRVFSGASGWDDSDAGSGSSGKYAGLGLTVFSAMAVVGLAVRIWRSNDPIGRVLAIAGLLVGAAAASFVLVIVVMAFGDLVDWLLRKRQG